ncbi:MAG: hypothetical protein HYT93_02680 [Parcubacteria group bacterium]|nr:hypothetical protein [Parcubacteria group bacterium]
MKKISLILFVLFFVPLLAGAQTDKASLEAAKARLLESREAKTVFPSVQNETRARTEEKATDIKTRTEQKIEVRTNEVKNTLSDKKETAQKDEFKKAEEKRTEVLQKKEEALRKTEEKRAEALQKKEEALQKRAEQEKQVIEKRKERIRAYFEKMFKRLDAAIERLQGLAERIESRIEKFEERDADVEKAKQLLAEAQTLIVSAEESLAKAKIAAEEVLSGENPKEIFTRVHESVKLVVSHTKEAHQALVEVIVALKGNDGGSSDSKGKNAEENENSKSPNTTNNQ